LYLTTMPEAFAGPYPTASAPQMQRLGYETYFWYAGPATWERISAFTQAQGYEHFFSRGDFGEVPGSVWGCEDKYLYERVLAGVPRERASFHVILNASNHSPYDVDLEAEGFPKDEVRRALPEEARDDEALLRELGHYWYADRELAGFIAKVKTELPDSLIVVVGDHADRYNMDKTPSDYERYGIPFIITGKGVHHGLMLPDAAGSQIDIVPTIVELIAPAGFEYDALGSSMSRTNRRAVNYGFWMTRRAMGRTDVIPLEPEAVNGTVGEVDREEMERYIDAVRSISWWRAKYGAKLDERLLEGR
ncbi:MAG: sulfatase-like hydrolase/transferase, partial [Selenomonadaceae bacterium]|nr:sulfatase-like hydrolase/transferase [Selenomonadaceae bacterium]